MKFISESDLPSFTTGEFDRHSRVCSRGSERIRSLRAELAWRSPRNDEHPSSMKYPTNSQIDSTTVSRLFDDQRLSESVSIEPGNLRGIRAECRDSGEGCIEDVKELKSMRGMNSNEMPMENNEGMILAGTVDE
jgi:hypothetical protein